MGRYTPSSLDLYWAHRQRDSLRAATDRRVAKQLLDQIYEWSAKQTKWGDNAGSWTTDMEYLCWRSQPKLRKLAEQAGGWWRWERGVVFVPLRQWFHMFDLEKESEGARRIYMKAERALNRLKRPKGGELQQRRWIERWEQGK